MHYLVTFLEGLISFISPCLLPMLPIYISYFAGDAEDNNALNKGSGGKTFINALSFTLGFTMVFLLLGLFAGAVGGLLRRYQTALNIISGLIVIFFGLNFLGVFKLNIFKGGGNFKNKSGGFFSSFVFGIIFSISWTPCVGAFLGSALMLASQRASAIQGALLLLSYSAGLGIPFILSAMLVNNLKSSFDFIKKHYKIINYISGGFLIITGILMMTGLLNLLFVIIPT